MLPDPASQVRCWRASYAMKRAMQGPVGCYESQAPSEQEFIRAREPDRSLRDQMAPDPVVVTNDARAFEVGPVVQGMPVRHHHDVVMI